MQKKGISLIVLVITIIVMIILAGAVIISLSNSGIIGNANKAVKTSNEATVKELAQMAWLDAYADGVRSVEDEGVTKGFKTRVEDTLRENGINLEDYLINVTTSGVTAKSIDKAWIKEGFTVKKGDKVLEIGDIINYDETAGGTKTGLTQTNWNVLGADDNGNLLIMSTANIDNVTLGEDGNITKCQQDWLNAPQILNTACEPYGYGEGAVGKARSITVEDINKLFDFDPTNVTANEYIFINSQSYGNKVTYKYNGKQVHYQDEYSESGNFKIASEAANGASGVSEVFYAIYYYDVPEDDITGYITDTGDKYYIDLYYYYDGRGFKLFDPFKTGIEVGEPIVESTDDYYEYWENNLDTKNAKVYEMLFSEEKSYGSFWLASRYIQARAPYNTEDAFTDIVYGIRRFDVGGVCGQDMLTFAAPSGNSDELGVCAVVTLSSDIEFTGSSAEGWTY